MFESKVTKTFVVKLLTRNKKVIHYRPTKKMLNINIQELYKIIVRSKPENSIKKYNPFNIETISDIIDLVNKKIEEDIIDVMVGRNSNGRYTKIGVSDVKSIN